MPPAHQRLGRHDGAGPQVDLGQVVQQQRFAVDVALQMQLDVVAERAFERHVIGGQRDLVAAPALGSQNGLVGTTQQIGAVVPPRHAHAHPDADGAGDHVAADRQALAQHRPEAPGERLRASRRHRLVRNDDELVSTQPGDHALTSRAHPNALREHPDEPVARGMAEVIVDRLEPVEVEVEDGDGSAPARGKPFGKVGDQRPTVVKPGQIVVLGQVAKLLLGRDPRLKLREQGGDGLERVDLFLLPLPGAELDEAEHAGGDLARHQRCGGDRGRDGLLVLASQRGKERLAWSGRITTGFLPCSHWASTGSALVKWTTANGSGSGTSVRGGHSATSTEARMSWSWWRRKLASTSNCSTSCARTFSLTCFAVDAVASISRVATEVTTRSRLRGKASSGGGQMSHLGAWPDQGSN